MRYTKTTALLLAACTACSILLSACGASSSSTQDSASFKSYSASSAAATAVEAPREMATDAIMEEAGLAMETTEAEADVDDSASDTAPVLDERKIVKYVDLYLETMEFDQALDQIINLVKENGGYIESQNVEGASLNYTGSYYEHTAYICARVPSEKLDTVTGAIGGLCNVLSKNERIDDISDHYYDSEARLKTLELQEERLLEILSKAEKLEDVITLEQSLSDVRYEIESLTASLRRMDSQVTYSYLNINLQEVVKYRQIDETPKSFGEELSAAFARGGRHLVDFTQGFLLVLAESLPMLLLLAAFALVVILIVTLLMKLSKKRRDQKYQEKLAKMKQYQEQKQNNQQPPQDQP